ncbi:Na(+)-translocating NADH-quinone reductase subunit A [Alienimonas californiensis]|uniref:Na(+)-translocating NADH-quinone reductase subunit A n=1 Tax=Alienimonas californiensis TaxID=2527989 RepID=A0A517PBG9_9PLAN|nr:Na(+)-translocating NADH-quinone reductase subunit A [Alienimonas californiensis]QDT16706.1 Na(+)-translocating NADH-quinone reductase subunit A [Alienimonas californiensis]
MIRSAHQTSGDRGRLIQVPRGLDLPIAGAPDQSRIDAKPAARVALLGDDYVGMKPTMLVAEGDRVKRGQPVFEDKKTEGVLFTAPASGTVSAINRGAKRKFLSLVIDAEGDEAQEFTAHTGDLSTLTRDQVRDGLVQSGLWPAFRARPFGKTPPPLSAPHSIFVTAIDTNPLAPDPVIAIGEKADFFRFGLQLLPHLTAGPVFLCTAPGANLPGGDLPKIEVREFAGPHPAGLAGTHIHVLDPVHRGKTVWHVGYQDVIAFGELFVTGRVSGERVVSLAGPQVKEPRLIRTTAGADLAALAEGELKAGINRVISGSVFAGHTALGLHAREHVGFLSRYANQISVLLEGNEREFLGWQKPGFDKYSVRRIFASAVTPGRSMNFTTSTGGSRRAMVPLGMYEQVMPLDIEPTFLLRALVTDDTENAQLLGALELIEEDIALCTFVCPGKTDYGPILRDQLDTIEEEG